MKEKLIVIDACVRQQDSRTLRIAEPVVEALSKRYDTIIYHLPKMEGVVPLTPQLFAARGEGVIPDWALAAAREIASADRLLIAAPFWDMGIPAVLKAFFEQTSLFDVTFTDNGRTCVGLCRAPKMLFITTRGMDIPTGDPREQATPYLRALGALWNLGDLTTIAVSGTDYCSAGELDAKLAAAVAEGLSLAASW